MAWREWGRIIFRCRHDQMASIASNSLPYPTAIGQKQPVAHDLNRVAAHNKAFSGYKPYGQKRHNSISHKIKWWHMAFNESLNSGLGKYRNNSLFSLFEPEGDLIDIVSSVDVEEDCARSAPALHVHEYVHYLHNISTTAGVQLLKNRLVSLRLFSTGADDNGHYIREGLIYKELSAMDAKELELDFCLILGSIEENKESGALGNIHCEFYDTRLESADPQDPYLIFGARINYEVRGHQRSLDLPNIGYHLITEGVAYEIDREVRRKIKNEHSLILDENTPAYPYMLFRKLVECYVGRACSTHELVKVGTLALQNKIPSWGLKASMTALKHGKKVFKNFIREMKSEHGSVVNGYSQTIKALLETTFKGATVSNGLKAMDKLVADTHRKRINDLFFELRFLEFPLTPEKFAEIVNTDMPPRSILQKKLDGSVDHYWMGSDNASLSDDDISALSTLQCALHYSQNHLSSQGAFKNTSTLDGKSSMESCPYLGACPLQKSRVDPELCRTSPWKHDLDISEGDVCWYTNGVKTLRNPWYKNYDDKFIASESAK
jgi:hypothetical protein